jgi:hypothetical protein
MLLFMVFHVLAKAQVGNYATADSASDALYNRADWRQLIISANRELQNGADFPALRLRLGYAYFMTQNYSAALTQYNQVFKADSYNQTARYYAYLCHRYLNQDLYANRQTAYFDSITISKRSNNFGLVSAAFEESFKVADNYYRGNSAYTRFGLGVELMPRLELDQSVTFFKQYIYLPKAYEREIERRHEFEDDQTEYYGALHYALTDHLALIGAYHYLYTTFRRSFNNSNVFMGGVNYTHPYFAVQADINAAHVMEDHFVQYNVQGILYPFGNLNLYSISRVAYHHQNATADFWIYSQAIGFKALKNIWLETAATFGDQENYIDADALYVYNTFDNTRFKLSETLFYQVFKNGTLQINYTFERKQEATESICYKQNGFTLGILWKF